MVFGKDPKVPQLSEDEARSRLREWMGRTGRSQADVAKQLAVSGGTLSQWLQAKYPGDSEGITSKVRALLAVEAERAEAPRALDFVPTRLALDLMEACRFAHVHRDIAVIYGDAGAGKTVALKRYRSEHVGSAVYVRCDPSFRSPQATLHALAQALGREPHWGGLRQAIAKLVDQLEGSGRLLMFDEANFLSLRSIEVLRTIHDMAEVGLVLCGNFEVYTQMHGEGRAAFAQLFSRVGIQRQVTLEIPIADVTALAASIAGELPDDCVAFLAQKAAERGGVRRLVKVLRLGCELAACDEVHSPTLRHLRMAEAMLMGGRGLGGEARRAVA